MSLSFIPFSIPFSEIVRQPDGQLHVSRLGALTSAGQQDDQFPASANKVDAIARTTMDSHFRDPGTDRPNVSGISMSQTINPRLDGSPGSPIFEIAEPSRELIRLDEANHPAQCIHLDTIAQERGRALCHIVPFSAQKNS